MASVPHQCSSKASGKGAGSDDDQGVGIPSEPLRLLETTMTKARVVMEHSGRNKCVVSDVLAALECTGVSKAPGQVTFRAFGSDELWGFDHGFVKLTDWEIAEDQSNEEYRILDLSDEALDRMLDDMDEAVKEGATSWFALACDFNVEEHNCHEGSASNENAETPATLEWTTKQYARFLTETEVESLDESDGEYKPGLMILEDTDSTSRDSIHSESSLYASESSTDAQALRVSVRAAVINQFMELREASTTYSAPVSKMCQSAGELEAALDASKIKFSEHAKSILLNSITFYITTTKAPASSLNLQTPVGKRRNLVDSEQQVSPSGAALTLSPARKRLRHQDVKQDA
mmetsp:Transcript_458/g.842  ORF Transcript_458/g.842 Transcript_458/m.842 type:complete len:347 (+) Transcript_458:103-1143(+)